MPTNFHWQSEDEKDWIENSPPLEEKRYGSKLSHHWKRKFLPILIIVSIIFVSVIVIQKLIAESENTIERDVLSSYELILLAIDNNDPEILASVLSGRDSAWADAQIDLINRGLLFDKHAFGLTLLSSEIPQQIDIQSSADLKEAIVTAPVEYQVEVGNGEFISITLENTLIFRLGDERWLLSPPENDFWGDTAKIEGHFLTLTVPERDISIGEDLAVFLEEKIAASCVSFEGSICTPDYHINVNLSTEPGSWLSLNSNNIPIDGGRNITLPTPSLVGKPVDESGYLALMRNYGEKVLFLHIKDLFHWSCCQRAVFFKVLSDNHLQELGIKPEPNEPEGFQNSVMYSQLEDLWETEVALNEILDVQHYWPVYLLIDYLLSNNSKTTSMELIQQLLVSNNFGEWLYFATDNSLQTSEELELTLQQHLQQELPS